MDDCGCAIALWCAAQYNTPLSGLSIDSVGCEPGTLCPERTGCSCCSASACASPADGGVSARHLRVLCAPCLGFVRGAMQLATAADFSSGSDADADALA